DDGSPWRFAEGSTPAASGSSSPDRAIFVKAPRGPTNLDAGLRSSARSRKGRHRMLEGLLLSAAAIAIGFVLLNQGAKFITDNATRISGRIGRSRFVVGALLVSTLSAPSILNLAISQRTGPADEIEERVEDLRIGLEFTGWIFGRKVEVRAGISWLIFGVLWSVMGAQFLVQGAISLSAIAGLSPWFVGITVVALGTSLPDIAAAYHATRRGYTDLVLGEGIGASVVTTLLTLGVIGILRPSTHSVELLL